MTTASFDIPRPSLFGKLLPGLLLSGGLWTMYFLSLFNFSWLSPFVPAYTTGFSQDSVSVGILALLVHACVLFAFYKIYGRGGLGRNTYIFTSWIYVAFFIWSALLMVAYYWQRPASYSLGLSVFFGFCTIFLYVASTYNTLLLTEYAKYRTHRTPIFYIRWCLFGGEQFWAIVDCNRKYMCPRMEWDTSPLAAQRFSKHGHALWFVITQLHGDTD